MMKYKLVRATSVDELEMLVNKALDEGWDLLNTPPVVATPTAVVWYLREMYKVLPSPIPVTGITMNEYQQAVEALRELMQFQE